MIKIKAVLILGVLLLLNGCSTKSNYELFQTENEVASEKVVANQKIEYKILPQDRVKITIYKYPELVPSNLAEEGQGLLIDSDGYIFLPLINRVKLSGLTQPQAARLLESKYKLYLTDPTVNVEVLNKRIYVLGEVKNPGVITLDKEKLTVIQAVAQAGDFTDAAVRDDIIVISHNAQDKMTMRKIDMLNFTHLSLTNMLIKPNDIIYVQPNGWKQFNVAAKDVTSVLDPILKIAGTYATFKYLAD